MTEPKHHEINIVNRGKTNVSGVAEVISADKSHVILETSSGRLFIRGNAISMGKLDVENGILSFDGNISSLEYKSSNKGNAGFKRLFR